MGRLDRTIRVAVWVLAMGWPTVACGWGRIGHDAVAYIAECNLSPKAQRIAETYLGHSIVYFSSWMDDYRRSPGYEHTTYWHMAPVDERMYYTDEVRSSRGDAVCELENAIGLLKNYRQLDDSTVAANLRYVIHLVGDMHCPAHVDYPGVELWYDVSFNGKKRSYHSVWDSGIIEASRKWHYVEWQQQLDRCTRRQKREIMAGTPRDWFHQTAVECRDIYALAPPGCELGRDFINAASPRVERQILRAGYRLAKVLNDLFG